MRLVRPVILFALVLAPVPASAHAEGFPHVNPRTLALDPGASEAIELEFEEGPFEAGWIMLVNVVVRSGSGPLDARLAGPTLEAASWSVPADGATHTLSTALPEPGRYVLEWTNAGPDALEAVFFYDQSCNCAAKPIPPDVPRAIVVFNADVKKGDTWRADIQAPPVHRLEVTLAAQTGDGGVYPDDFRAIATSRGATELPDGRRVHEIEWTAADDGRHYFFVQTVEADLGRFDTSSPTAAVMSVMVIPEFELVEGGSNQAPGPHALALVSGLAACAFALGRRWA